ncbi:hypothetical protein ACFOGJ_09925 [Marinibaculum pumilum]|uniref:YtkA-like domain-containing protein n=1 Tax=Marinibaculum pumilum TaxID=1766165 RepID=A0ABV7KZH0_9PROT
MRGLLPARLILVALAVVAPATTVSAAPDGCRFADGGDAAGSLTVDGQAYLFRFDPPRLGVGQRFSVDVKGCGAAAATLAGVDARMPAHRHGMNYRPRLQAVSATAWRAEGLLLHMPGSWRFLFIFDGPSGRTVAAVDRKVQ